jgi:hypothetical protein
MKRHRAVTEADILAQLVAPNEPEMNAGFAKAVLAVKFNSQARKRMRTLAAKNRRGTLSDEERTELDKYLRVGLFVDLMQAKARLSLTSSEHAA